MHIVITLQDIVSLILDIFLLSLLIFCKLADIQTKRRETKKQEKEKQEEDR